MATLYSSSEIAELYVKYRPVYPAFVYDKIFQVLDDDDEGGSAGGGRESGRRRRFAVDVGCGSGQSTRQLAEHFDRVLGLDSSEAQLNEARAKFCSGGGVSNVVFRCETADRLSEVVDEGSADVVTVATALHFFASKSFFEKCLKVLRSGGVMAAYCYFFKMDGWDNADAGRIFEEFFRDFINTFIAQRAKDVLNKYEDLLSILAEVFPKTERFSRIVVQNRSLDEVAGFIRSMSSYRAYLEQNPSSDEDPVKTLISRLKVVYGVDSEDEPVVNMPMEYFMIIGKKA